MPHCPHCFRGALRASVSPPGPRSGVWRGVVDIGVFAFLGCVGPAVIPVFGFGVCCGHHAQPHGAHTAPCPPRGLCAPLPTVALSLVSPAMATITGGPQIPHGAPLTVPGEFWGTLMGLGVSCGSIHPSVLPCVLPRAIPSPDSPSICSKIPQQLLLTLLCLTGGFLPLWKKEEFFPSLRLFPSTKQTSPSLIPNFS